MNTKDIKDEIARQSPTIVAGLLFIAAKETIQCVFRCIGRKRKKREESASR
jgi:hypothetical protein